MRLRWPYIVVGYALIAVVIVVAFWAGNYRKRYAEMKELDGKIAAQQKIIDREASVRTQLAQKKVELTRVKVEFEAIQDAKMPPLDFQDPFLGTMALWFEQRDDLGPAVLEFFAKSSIVPTPFGIPAPNTEPQSFPPGALMQLMPPTTVTFTATLDQLLDFLYSFGEAKRVIATGGSISLSPADPSGELLQVTLPIAVYTFVRVPPGASLAPTAAARPAAAVAGAAGPGAGARAGVPGAGAGAASRRAEKGEG